MFCPECGDSKSELIEGLCKNCFLKQFSPLSIPSNIFVRICVHCKSKFHEGKWKDSNIDENEIIYRALENAIKINPLIKNEEIELKILQIRGTIAECNVEVSATVLGELIHEEFETNVRLNRSVCPTCSKKNSGYYEAVIQLRSDNRDLKDEELRSINALIHKSLNNFHKKDKLSYLSQKLDLKEGVDYYIGSLKSAKKLAMAIKKDFGGLIKESPRLITQDKSTGKGIYRVWISIRLPIFNKGDFIKYNNRIAQVINFDGKKIIANDLKLGEKFTVLWKDYELIEFLMRSNNVKKTTIISKSPKNLQILDPVSFEVVDIRMNSKFNSYNIDDEVDVININEFLYIL
jgi:nonsense-mediated mRNA decay protein 3